MKKKGQISIAEVRMTVNQSKIEIEIKMENTDRWAKIKKTFHLKST
jgi:translation initiation factor IF-3